MARSRVAHRVRLKLSQLPGFSQFPRCEFCGALVRPLEYSLHTRSCGRQWASLTIEAIDRRHAVLYSTQPLSDAHAADMERESESLRQERWEAYTLIFDFDSLGRGKVSTGVPDDGELPI